MLGTLFKQLVLLAGVSGVAATSQLSQDQIQWYRAQLGASAPQIVPPGMPSDPLADALVTWKRLQQSDNLPFSDYATFLLAHPDWPGQTSRRAAAETALTSGTWVPALTIRFFEKFPPLTAAGHVRFAEALAASGRMEEARDHARAAWRRGALRVNDETVLRGSFFSAFSRDDQDARMDMLLWQNAVASAQRQLEFTSPERRPIFEARLAMRANAPDAATKAMLALNGGMRDPGYLADRAAWLRQNGQPSEARALLAQPHRLGWQPTNVEQWYEVLLANARGAAADSDSATAYNIARQVDDAYPPNTTVSERPYGERDDYTSLVWLAGTLAMQKLARPRDAVGLFERYANGSRTPQTQSKGLYWAGRAAEASGQADLATGYYTRAAGFSSLFYGQLAAEHLHIPLRAPPALAGRVADAPVREAFYRRETVRAAELLGQLGNWQTQGLFIRQIANDATSDTDHLLAAELSRAIGRPDLGVMVGRSALENGLTDYTAAGYPSITVPAAEQDSWTMIHAIARQESQFDMQAVSRVGARGLMQLMPSTARWIATRAGLAWDPSSLSDPQYNIQLGSTYFQQLLDRYGNCYPLAVAAYNAGPGNVSKWLAANGDPRLPGSDMVDWIEKIPIFETKNYVQRVLENAVVYDLMSPAHARSHGPANLSWYLGKHDQADLLAGADAISGDGSAASE